MIVSWDDLDIKITIVSERIQNMKHMKKNSIFLGILFLFCWLAAFCLKPSNVYAESVSVEAQSISWEITEDGVLRISGEGMIPNNMHPWLDDYTNREKINSIIIEEGITRIGDYAIGDLPNVKNINLPSTLKEIGGQCFRYMDSLTSISFPENLEMIDYCCFQNCDALKEVIIPVSVTSIGWGCFTQNPSLERIVVDSQNPNYLSEDGILYNKSKTSLLAYPIGRTDKIYTVPDCVRNIDEYAFSGSAILQEVKLSFGCQTISMGAFESCNQLKTINIPASITYIDANAFGGCSIENIIIPDSVTYIGSSAFNASTIITCTKDSVADRYAQENGNSILYIENHNQVYESPESAEHLKRWEKASAEFLEFIIKHINDDKSTFTHFVGIMVDGEHVAPENYTAEPGSLILRLKASYLETLSPGEHTLKAIFDDGEIEIPFLVDTEKAIDHTKFEDVAVPTDSFSFKKVWQGDHEDSIDFTLYKADGSVYHHGFDKRVVSKTEWRYNAYFSAPAACYVIEKPMPGYQTKYVNVGVYADVTDRCCDGGTIINKKVPKTGDAADFALWAGILALGIVDLTAMVILTRRKRAHK